MIQISSSVEKRWKALENKNQLRQKSLSLNQKNKMHKILLLNSKTARTNVLIKFLIQKNY